MFNAEVDTDVLIVGAGPVGLFLANECARRGLRFRLVEAHASQSMYSKALAIFPRTMEILDMAGLVGPFLEQANRVTSVAIVSHGRALTRMQFAPKETPYPFIAMVPQNVTEELLVAQLQASGGTVEYETKFASATQHDDHVSVIMDRKGQPLTLKASFVVGCDGAHSAVRHLLALPFEGAQYDAAFMLADVDISGALAPDELQLCPDASGPLAIFPISEKRARVVAIVNETEGDSPSLDLVRRLLVERAASEIDASVLHWSSYFRVHHRLASELRVGRIFIAGDAAHIHSPFGGQGMNTGLQDVWNLAWKLDLAVRGRASPALLESYAAERLPVIRGVIETTHRMTRALGARSTFAQALRDTLIPAVTRLATFQHSFVKRLSGLGIEYHESPIVEGEGQRYFDDSLRGGHGISSRFLLLGPRPEDSATRAEILQFAEQFSDLVELRLRGGGETVLVRPDGYVAHTVRAREASAGLRTLRSVVARQTQPSATG